MTEYDGKAITYDDNGNPLTYDGYTYSWQKGRQLAGISGSGLTAAYEYGYNGLRTKKTVNSVETEYTYAGDLLMSQKDGTNTLYWTYDAAGRMVGVNYNGINYYYMRNLQGDVIAIYDNNANIVARYLYDTWGKVVAVTDDNSNAISSATHIGNVNPIRYRGYYFDVETGYYYLQSRYYNPEWCRFLNADALFLAGDALIGANMFACCLNNVTVYMNCYIFYLSALIYMAS